MRNEAAEQAALKIKALEEKFGRLEEHMSVDLL